MLMAKVKNKYFYRSMNNQVKLQFVTFKTDDKIFYHQVNDLGNQALDPVFSCCKRMQLC